METYLTVKEVASILRRSTDTIYRWLQEGQMFPHAVRVKAGYLIPEADVDAVLKTVTAKDP